MCTMAHAARHPTGSRSYLDICHCIVQVQTLLRVRTRQLMRLRDLESAGAVLGMQAC